MCMRWTTAGMLEAETRFRKVEGYRSLAQLAIHIETDLIKRRNQLHAELTQPPMCGSVPKGTVARSDFHDGRDNLQRRSLCSLRRSRPLACQRASGFLCRRVLG